MSEIEESKQQGHPAGNLCLRCNKFTPGGVHSCECHTKKKRFFGNWQYFGDGCGDGRIYLGDRVADVIGQIESALEAALEEGARAETIRISVDEMTDAEIDALREL